MEPGNVDIGEADFTKLAKWDFNGRQIKSAIKTARVLASRKQEALNVGHLDIVLKLRSKTLGLMSAELSAGNVRFAALRWSNPLVLLNVPHDYFACLSLICDSVPSSATYKPDRYGTAQVYGTAQAAREDDVTLNLQVKNRLRQAPYPGSEPAHDSIYFADQPYAILSHTWDSPDKEVTYQEMVATPRSDALMTKPGYRKIIKTCEVARDRYSLSWAWIDTCCIDKSSSADLSEAINSMFSWYKAAVVCIAYLSDFDGYNEPVIGCRWFTRGWTLQELIAPKELVFINNEWRLCGTKEARAQEISKGTGIPVSILKHEKHLDDVPVAARMSWASTRETTRIEDLAYCLLGISDVNMPILYGEGQKAFLRLQDAILSQNDDLSLFLWTDEESAEPYIGLFAHHPRCFKGKGRTESRPSIQQHDVSSTNRGIRLNSELATTPETNMALLSLKHSLGRDEPTMALCLRQVGMDMYVRVGPTSLSRVRRNADQTLINVAKVLTSAHSAAIAENRIHISLGTDLRIFGGRPHASWDPRARVFYAGYKGGFMGELKIRISKEDWFVLQCEFCNGQWAVGTLKKEQWDKFVKRTTWEYYDKTRDFAIGLNEDGTLIRHPGSSNTIIRAWVDEVQTSTAFVKITTEVTAP